MIAGPLRYRHIPAAARLAERLAVGLLDAAAAFGGRLPELFCGFPRSKFHAPVPFPTTCAPQAWASAAPTVVPALPKRWGTVMLTDLRLGDEVSLDIEAKGDRATIHHPPEGWRITTVATAPN